MKRKLRASRHLRVKIGRCNWWKGCTIRELLRWAEWKGRGEIGGCRRGSAAKRAVGVCESQRKKKRMRRRRRGGIQSGGRWRGPPYEIGGNLFPLPCLCLPNCFVVCFGERRSKKKTKEMSIKHDIDGTSDIKNGMWLRKCEDSMRWTKLESYQIEKSQNCRLLTTCHWLRRSQFSILTAGLSPGNI